MNTIFTHVVSLLGAASLVCFLVALILYLHLVQQAFNQSGVIWGLISVVYPPGTYYYCRKNWDIYRSRFILISALLLVFLVSFVISKLV